jgi:GDP-4-dehydro-6-deoxy-D-mannose reductase
MRVLVTGADGFVGRHLCTFLHESGDVVVPLAGRVDPSAPQLDAPTVDVRDAEAIREAITRARPEAIVHLAGIASVAVSHAQPAMAFEVNALGTLNVCVAARALESDVRLVLVSSGEVYGATATSVPATEQTPLAPTSPYAASKVAAETIGFQFARSYGMHVICARPFSHLGAGQAPTFAIPSFAKQLEDARRSGQPAATLAVGNLEAIRDFSHVRDVVAGYRLLIERGISGEAYNICSGVGRTIRSVLDELIERADMNVEVHVDPSKLRPADIPSQIGNAAKLHALGWKPRWTVGDALADVLRAERAR